MDVTEPGLPVFVTRDMLHNTSKISNLVNNCKNVYYVQ